VFQLYKQGKIKYPVHLRSGREQFLIDLFKHVRKEDHVYAYWDAHDICLCKGVPSGLLRKAILSGNSIALNFPSHNIICSGIAGSLMGVAVGHAWGLKKKDSSDKVFLFCGDMSAEMGIFHESVKYAYNFNLPIQFIVSDNGLSVMTDTRETWGEEMPWWIGTKYEDIIIHREYVNGYPHSGIGKRVKF